MVAQHIQALVAILFAQCNAGTFQRFLLSVPRPAATKIFAPCPDRSGVLNRRCLFQAMTACDINGVGVTVPDQLDSSKGVIPTKVHSTDAWPMTWEITMLDCNLGFAFGLILMALCH